MKSTGIIGGTGYQVQVVLFDGAGTHVQTEGSTETTAGRRDWHRFSTEFVTRPAIGKGEIRLLVNGAGEAWFDDLSLERVQEEYATANLFRNTSFENNTVPPAPDDWGMISGGVRQPHLIENMFKWWGIDTDSRNAVPLRPSRVSDSQSPNRPRRWTIFGRRSMPMRPGICPRPPEVWRSPTIRRLRRACLRRNRSPRRSPRACCR